MPGPSNLYGVANPVMLPVAVWGNVTGTANPGVPTNIFPNTVLASPSPGWIYPIAWVSFYVGWLTPLPTDFHCGLTVNGGSFVDQYQIDTALMIASDWLAYSACMIGTPSNTAWAGTGSTLNVTFNAVTNAVGVRGYSNKVVYALFRAPDQ